MPSPRRDADPLKITSIISPPRRLLALCSPSTQRTASTMLLLPEPLGPTMPVTPAAKSNTVLSANDLNPASSNRLSILAALSCLKKGQDPSSAVQGPVPFLDSFSVMATGGQSPPV